MALVYLLGGIQKSIQSTRSNAKTADSLPKVVRVVENEFSEPGEDRFGLAGYGNPMSGMTAPGVPFLDGAPMGDIAGMLQRFYKG